MTAVSCSSTRNVLRPVIRLSLAPMRTKMRSQGEREKCCAGTSHPSWKDGGWGEEGISFKETTCAPSV